MAQITIEVDSATFNKLKRYATKNHTSISAWIKSRILKVKGLKKEWPEDYFSVFGAINDEDLVEPIEIPFEYDSKRENL